MAGEINTNTTSLNDLLPSIVAEALFVASERSLLRNLVKNFTLPMGSGKTVTVPIYNAVTAAGLTEADDLSATAVSTGGAVLTVAEVGIMAKVSDLSVNASAANVVADVGRLFGEAIARKMDADIAALFAGFSTVVGSNSTTITVPHIFQAIAKLRAASVPSDGLVCVLHPEVAYDLKSALTNAFANPNPGIIQNEAMATGYLGMLGGVPVFESAAIVSTTGDSVGGLFHRDALGLALMKDIGIELQRDASARATEVVATAVYGVGELVDQYGVALSFDSTLANAA